MFRFLYNYFFCCFVGIKSNLTLFTKQPLHKPHTITTEYSNLQFLQTDSPDREVYRDPDIVRAEEQIEDSIIAQETHTTTKVLNKFRQMEENLHREPLNLGPKPLKRFTPPPEPARPESGSEADGSESEEDSEPLEEVDQSKLQDADLLEAQKAARARQLRAKFEKWEAKEIKREQQQVNIIEDMGEDQSQVESTKA